MVPSDHGAAAMKRRAGGPLVMVSQENAHGQSSISFPFARIAPRALAARGFHRRGRGGPGVPPGGARDAAFDGPHAEHRLLDEGGGAVGRAPNPGARPPRPRGGPPPRPP